MFEPRVWDGGKITQPCLIKGMPLSAYHGDCCDAPSFSSSGLREIWHKSPEDYWARSPYNTDRKDYKEEDDEQSSDQIMGSAVHHLLLGEKLFSASYIEQPATYPAGCEYPDNGGPNAVRKKWTGAAHWCQDWEADIHASGKKILTPDEMENILGMARSLGRNELVRQGALKGLIECSLFWKDRKTGFWLKARPDVIPTASGDVTDLKTTRSVLPGDLRRTIEKFAYEQQAALVAEGLQTVLNVELTTFTLLFIKKKPPWSCWPIWLKDIDLITGFEMNRAALDIAASCFKSGVWYGPGGEHNLGSHMELSKWRRDQIKDRLELMGYDVQKDDANG